MFILKKVEELRILKEKTPKDLWKEDINEFMEELDVSGKKHDSPTITDTFYFFFCSVWKLWKERMKRLELR